MCSATMNFIIRTLLFLTFACFLHFASSSKLSADTLVQGDQLTANDRLISSAGLFILRFFQPDEDNNKFYLGILAKTFNSYFWVANRDVPILDDPGILTIDKNGSLNILSNKHNPSIVLYSAEGAANTSAILLDTGNFVLREMNLDGSVKRILWQSFDFPTDTLLPGMKLGFEKNTGKNWSLTSRLSTEAVSSGTFTLGIEPITNQLVSWMRGIVVWRSGDWINGSFINLKSTLQQIDYNFTYFLNESVTYLNFASVSGSITIDMLGVVHGQSGEFLSCVDDPIPQGCDMPKPPQCRIEEGVYLPWNSLGVMSVKGFRFDESENLSISDCWTKCLNDCSCEAYSFVNEEMTGCEIWRRGSSAKLFAVTNVTSVGRPIYFLNSKAKGKSRKLIISATAAGGALLLIISCFVSLVLWKKQEQRAKKKNTLRNLLCEIRGNSGLSNANIEGRKERESRKENNDHMHIFNFESILEATDKFSSANILGEGGFGPVYKGKLSNGQEVAIKRLSRRSGQGLAEFKNEANLIVKLQHTNLVRLLGFCVEKEERMLVYEYMPNKSLDLYLFDSDKKSTLSWEIRLGIIEGVVEGLVYLHKYSRLKVIHRDLKASNILLDNELKPKISDFGMARIFALTETEEITSRVVGTHGYMSPEYIMWGTVSSKIDVYSFGILLLEILSGKKMNGFYDHDRSLNLLGYAWQLWNEGKALELIDPTLDGSYPCFEVLRCVQIALLCVQDEARDRPTMMEVLSFLSNETAQLPPPKHPAFYSTANMKQIEQQKTGSINEVTISVIDGR